jgi:microcystin-dependent protein
MRGTPDLSTGQRVPASAHAGKTRQSFLRPGCRHSFTQVERTRTIMAFWSWSKTAASNATADATINWAEGQSPSSVNDSARAMMARAAEWRDDVSGTITTFGSATAYMATSNQGFDTLGHLNGAMIAFVPHTSCGATVTLNVDGQGAKPLRTSPGAELQAGMLIQGTPYVATYNSADGAFYLRGFYALPYAIPIGGLLPYVGISAPNSNFALPFGQAVSRTTYATLFSLTSTTFGVGDGSTTFNLPDLRGRAIFGLDNMGGSAASRITVAGGNFDGTVLGNAGGAQNQTLTQAQLPAVAPTFTGNTVNVSGGFVWGGSATSNAGASAGSSPLASNFVIGSVTPTGTIGNLGSGNAHPILSPAMVLPFILRVI